MNNDGRLDIKKIGCIKILKNLLTKCIKICFVHYQIKKRKLCVVSWKDGNLRDTIYHDIYGSFLCPVVFRIYTYNPFNGATNLK